MISFQTGRLRGVPLLPRKSPSNGFIACAEYKPTNEPSFQNLAFSLTPSNVDGVSILLVFRRVLPDHEELIAAPCAGCPENHCPCRMAGCQLKQGPSNNYCRCQRSAPRRGKKWMLQVEHCKGLPSFQLGNSTAMRRRQHAMIRLYFATVLNGNPARAEENLYSNRSRRLLEHSIRIACSRVQPKYRQEASMAAGAKTRRHVGAAWIIRLQQAPFGSAGRQSEGTAGVSPGTAAGTEHVNGVSGRTQAISSS